MSKADGTAMGDLGEYLVRFGFREWHSDDGGIIVYREETPVLMTENPTVVEAYYAGVVQGVSLAECAGNRQTSPVERRKKGGKIDTSLELDRKEIFSRFESELDSHTSVAYGFALDWIEGGSHEEKLQNLLVEIIGHLKDLYRTKKHISCSLFLEPATIKDWGGLSNESICLYIGSCEEHFDGSIVDKLNLEIMKMQSYVCAESGTPEEDALLIGFYSPGDRTLFLSKEYQLSWDVSK